MYGALFVAKRALIYAMAGTVVVIASVRGASDDANLGGRLVALTQEVLPQFGDLEDTSEKEEEEETDEDGNVATGSGAAKAKATKEDTRFEELQVLDGVETSTLSVALPLLVASSLAFSVFLLKLQETAGSGGAAELFGGLDDIADGLGLELGGLSDAFSDLLPKFSALSNALVVSLFTRAEVERALRALSPASAAVLAPSPTSSSSSDDDDDDDDDAAFPFLDAVSSSPLAQSALAAAVVAALAYLGPPGLVWPLRNVVGVSIGVAVARAVQLPRLPNVLVALSLLVAYDVFSVGVQLVNLGSASLATTAAATAAASSSSSASSAAATAAASASISASSSGAASSAMGAVALSKVGGATGAGAGAAAASSSSSFALPSWQPGLLEVELRGRVTDLLGLGDAVFPSLLSTFCLRFDQRSISNSNSNSNINSSRSPSSDFSSPFPLYFAASLLGFIAGCVACDLAPGIDSSGLPALLFIVPAMATTTLGLAAARGELAGPNGMWAFDPASASTATSDDVGE